MAIEQGMTISFMTEMGQAIHNFTTGTGDTFKIALYADTANIGPSTATYTATGEISGTGYVAGGTNLTGMTLTYGSDYMYVSWSNPSWGGATLTARGAMIYNSSKANRSVAVLDFGSNKSVTATTFTVFLPANLPTSAIIRFKRAY